MPRVKAKASLYKPNDELQVNDYGTWHDCVIKEFAPYGGGYYATYEPRRDTCLSFWVHDGDLRKRPK